MSGERFTRWHTAVFGRQFHKEILTGPLSQVAYSKLLIIQKAVFMLWKGQNAFIFKNLDMSWSNILFAMDTHVEESLNATTLMDRKELYEASDKIRCG